KFNLSRKCHRDPYSRFTIVVESSGANCCPDARRMIATPKRTLMIPPISWSDLKKVMSDQISQARILVRYLLWALVDQFQFSLSTHIFGKGCDIRFHGLPKVFPGFGVLTLEHPHSCRIKVSFAPLF